jgi:hypothetical protein
MGTNRSDAVESLLVLRPISSFASGGLVREDQFLDLPIPGGEP